MLPGTCESSKLDSRVRISPSVPKISRRCTQINADQNDNTAKEVCAVFLICVNPRLINPERRCRAMALNGRVLLLNQTYEPLGTVSVARAIVMTFKNTVFVEELDGDRVLRSAHAEFPVPSVIR